MKKYSKEIITDYMYCNDIDYDIEELENDMCFMIEVLKASKDKNTYENTCSDDMKENFEFVKEVLTIFKDDVNFAIKVANNFLEKSDNDEENFEINIIMREITKNVEDEGLKLPFYLATNIEFFYKELCIEATKAENDKEINDFVGLGFEYYKDMYPNNKTILDFVAKNYIEDIFFEKLNLQEILHNTFKSYEKFEEFGRYKFLSKYISSFDDNLTNYILQNTNCLDSLNKALESIKKNWDLYNNNKDKNLIEAYQSIIYDVCTYIQDNSDCRFDTEAGLYYVAREFGIEDEIRSLDCRYAFKDELIEDYSVYDEEPFDVFDRKIKEETEEKIMLETIGSDENESADDLYDDLYGISDSNFHIEDVKHIKNIRKIFAENLGIELPEKQQQINENGNKVLYFNIKNKKKDEEK